MGGSASMGSGPLSVRSQGNIESSVKQDKDKVNQKKMAEGTGHVGGKDVMISYSHADKEMMQKLKAGLESHGITVWVDVIGLKAGVDFLSKIGEAIIDAKLFISLLSEKTIQSKFCQDELALAYVSNKPIFPVGLKSPQELFPKMDTGMKLQLARFKWTLLVNEEQFDENLKSLVAEMKGEMEDEVEEDTGEGPSIHDPTGQSRGPDHEVTSGEKLPMKPVANTTSGTLRQQSKPVKSAYRRSNSEQAGISTSMSNETMLSFWERHWTTRQQIEWNKFEDAMVTEYNEDINRVYNGEDKAWLLSILRRELEVDSNEGNVTKQAYLDFCSVGGELKAFWLRVQDQAVESYTMKEVFDMESSVRVEAIENLGKFKSTSVVGALIDLLTDPSPDVRAVAAISLARATAEGSDHGLVVRKLIKCLEDKDRLVRESGCLALGHLKAHEAVAKLVQLWRNDFISHVREAAQVALEQIGGEEAEKAMHMTKVLAEEIRTLTQE